MWWSMWCPIQGTKYLPYPLPTDALQRGKRSCREASALQKMGRDSAGWDALSRIPGMACLRMALSQGLSMGILASMYTLYSIESLM